MWLISASMGGVMQSTSQPMATTGNSCIWVIWVLEDRSSRTDMWVTVSPWQQFVKSMCADCKFGKFSRLHVITHEFRDVLSVARLWRGSPTKQDVVISVTEVLSSTPCEAFCMFILTCVDFCQFLWLPPTDMQIVLTGQSDLWLVCVCVCAHIQR